MTATPTSTDEYLAALPEDRRAVLEAIRTAIAAAAPGAEEGFSYRMPAFALDGRPLLWFAAWKHHYGLYPVSAAMLAAHAADAAGYAAEKGTIRFPAAEPVPLGLVTKLVTARMAELRAG
jgi:uncharacterized protein YdhG (YjbR/CyaY superfamily)